MCGSGAKLLSRIALHAFCRDEWEQLSFAKLSGPRSLAFMLLPKFLTVGDSSSGARSSLGGFTCCKRVPEPNLDVQLVSLVIKLTRGDTVTEVHVTRIRHGHIERPI